jgi:hypothetical protein
MEITACCIVSIFVFVFGRLIVQSIEVSRSLILLVVVPIAWDHHGGVWRGSRAGDVDSRDVAE